MITTMTIATIPNIFYLFIQSVQSENLCIDENSSNQDERKDEDDTKNVKDEIVRSGGTFVEIPLT